MRREAEAARAADGVHRHERLIAAIERGDAEAILPALGAHGARAYLGNRDVTQAGPFPKPELSTIDDVDAHKVVDDVVGTLAADGVWISTFTAEQLHARAAEIDPALPLRRAAVRGQGQHRRRRAADHRRLPRLRLPAAAQCAGGAATGRRGCDRRRQDEPGPVRHRADRRPLPVRDARRASSAAASSRAARVPARPSRWRTAAWRSPSARTRPAPDGCRQRSTASSGSSRPAACSARSGWCRPAGRWTAYRSSPATSRPRSG